MTEGNLLGSPFFIDNNFYGYNINIFKNEDNSLEFTIKKNNDIYYLKYKERDILDYFSHHNFDLFEPDFQRYLNNRQFQITEEGRKLIIKLTVEDNENFRDKKITLVKLNDYFSNQINILNDKIQNLEDLKQKLQKKVTLIVLLSIIIFFNVFIFIYIIINDKKRNDYEYIRQFTSEILKINKDITEIKDINSNQNDKPKIEDLINMETMYEFLDEKFEKFNKLLNDKFNSIKVQYIKTNLTEETKFNNLTKGDVNSLKIFPEGKIVVVSNKTITLLDEDLSLIKINESAHNDAITYVDIYDENNFVTSSKDKSIKTWIKTNNGFSMNKPINNAHNDLIYKVIYDSKGKLYSSSYDDTIKIWELKNNGDYDNIKTLNHSNDVSSILLLEDKKMLISGGEGIKFWNLNDYQIIKSNDNIYMSSNNCIERIGKNEIIVCDENQKKLLIFSIESFEIIKEINNIYIPVTIKLIDNKGLIFVSGENNGKYNLKIYTKDNLELLQTIENLNEIHSDFIELKNHSILSSSWNGTINLWNF